MNFFKEIPESLSWKHIEEIKKGWSKDRKYYVETADSKKLLLRIADLEFYERKAEEFDFLKKVNALDFKMSKALSFGKTKNFVYMILEWIDGVSLNEVLASLPEEMQYQLGVQAGKALKAVHSLGVEKDSSSPLDKKKTMLKKLEIYESGKVRIKKDYVVINFVKKNIDYIFPYTPVYQHGDFHIGNMLLTPEGELAVIDFNRFGVGDSCEEFLKVQSFDVSVSIPFAIGQIHSYFSGIPKIEFWKKLALFCALSALYSISWAEKFGSDEVEKMKEIYFQTIKDYENFTTDVPKWYKENCKKYIV